MYKNMPNNLSNKKHHITYDKFFFVAPIDIVILFKNQIIFFMLSHILTMSPLAIKSNSKFKGKSFNA